MSTTDAPITRFTFTVEAIQMYIDTLDGKKTARTIKTYRGALRTLLRPWRHTALGNVPAAKLRQLALNVSSIYSKAYFTTMCAAYSGFYDWCMLFDVHLPPPFNRRALGLVRDNEQLERKRGKVALPPVVVQAVRTIMRDAPKNYLRLADLLEITWEQTTSGMGADGETPTISIPMARNHGELLNIPATHDAFEAMKILYLFGRGDQEMPRGPLVPTAPNSGTSVTLGQMRAALRDAGHVSLSEDLLEIPAP